MWPNRGSDKKLYKRPFLSLVLSLASVAGAVIQATGRTDFEDGLWIGNQLLVRNGLQRVCTIPEINATIVPGGGVDQVPPGADQGPKFCRVPRNQWY